MARYIYSGTARDGAGNVIASASVTVYLAGTTTLATIYAAYSGGSADADSVVASGTDGTFTFYVDDTDYLSNQLFKVVISKSGYESKTYDYLTVIGFNTALSHAARANIKYVGYYTDLATAVSTIGSTECTLIIDESETVSDDLTIPATMAIEIKKGAIITVANTKTLTINGLFKAGPYQVFTLTGTGVAVFGVAAVDEIDPRWWGYAGNGVADDGAVINKAIASRSANSTVPIIIPLGSGLCTTSVAINTNNVKLKGLGTSSILVPPASGWAIKVAQNNSVTGTEICDLLVSGDGTVTGGILLGNTGESYYTAYTKLDNVYVWSCSAGTGIRAFNAQELDIVNCNVQLNDYGIVLSEGYITSTHIHGARGIIAQNATGIYADTNTIFSSFSLSEIVVESNTSYGVYIVNANADMHIHNVHFESNARALTVGGTSGANNKARFTLKDCTWSSNTDDVLTTVYVENSLVAHNHDLVTSTSVNVDANSAIHFEFNGATLEDYKTFMGSSTITALEYDATSQLAWMKAAGTTIDYNTAAPVSGTWIAGSIRWNSSPSTGNPIGWICTVSSPTNTWVAMANL